MEGKVKKYKRGGQKQLIQVAGILEEEPVTLYCKGSRQDRESRACAEGDDACAVIRGESLSAPGNLTLIVMWHEKEVILVWGVDMVFGFWSNM